MKNLGVISVLLAMSNFGFAGSVFAETKQSFPAEGKLTLAMNEFVTEKEPMIKIETKRFDIDERATLVQVNAKLEEKLAQKFDSLLADQLDTLNLP